METKKIIVKTHIMNRLYALSIFLFILLLPKAYAQSLVTITVENKGNSPRTDEMISIPWSSLLAIRPNMDTANFSVSNVATKEKIPFQFELQGKNTIQHTYPIYDHFVYRQGKIVSSSHKNVWQICP